MLTVGSVVGSSLAPVRRNAAHASVIRLPVNASLAFVLADDHFRDDVVFIQKSVVGHHAPKVTVSVPAVN